MTLLERIRALPIPTVLPQWRQAEQDDDHIVWGRFLEFDPSDGLLKVDLWTSPNDLRELADFQERLQAAVKAHQEEQCRIY